MNKKFYEYGRSFEDWNCVLKLENSSTISTCLLTTTGVSILPSAMQFLCIPNLWSRVVYLSRNPLYSYTFNLNAISSSNWNSIFEYKVNRITIHIKPSPSAVQYQTFTPVEKSQFYTELSCTFATGLQDCNHFFNSYEERKKCSKVLSFCTCKCKYCNSAFKGFSKDGFFLSKEAFTYGNTSICYRV